MTTYMIPIQQLHWIFSSEVIEEFGYLSGNPSKIEDQLKLN